MSVNLEWRDAMTQASRAFTRPEQATGWPATLTPGQLAELQRPWATGDKLARSECAAFHDELAAACVAVAIKHTTNMERVIVRPAKFVTVGATSLLGGAKVGYTRPAESKAVTHRHISAPAFAAWLTALGVEPSRHVSAWFKSQGVGVADPMGERAHTPAAQASAEVLALPTNKGELAPIGPAPLKTPAIAEAFEGVDGLTAKQWSDRLGDLNNHKWLTPARATQGKAPRPATWWPLKLGEILEARGIPFDALNRLFLNRRALKPWLPAWQEAKRQRNAFGQ